jgi:hypothetical protein
VSILYLAPTSAAAAFRWGYQDDAHLSPITPDGQVTLPAPSNPAVALVLVHGAWIDAAAQASWETTAGVRRVHPEELAQVVPALFAAAFAGAGVLATDTGRQALAKIRTWWPHPPLWAF